MAERKVSGTDVVLLIDLAGGTSYDLVICLTSNSFNAAVSEIDAKSKCGADSLPGTLSFNVDFEGQIVYDCDTDRISASALYTALVNKTTISWKMAKATPVTDDVVYTGTAFISKLDQTFGDDAPATFSASLGIFGTPVQAITV